MRANVERKSKVKIHFNRINMMRKDPRVWSAHTSKSCNMSVKVVVMHQGKVVLETVYDENKKANPRAFLVAKGTVKQGNDGTTIIEV